MECELTEHRRTPDDERRVAELLLRAFVDEGHTGRENAGRLTAAEELRKRGTMILARALPPDERILGMVILAEPSSPLRQIAHADEAELQLLAVAPGARGHGLGRRLVAACEQQARARGYARMVLSTQPAMLAAHRVYEQADYRRNALRDWTRADGRTFLVFEKHLTW